MPTLIHYVPLDTIQFHAQMLVGACGEWRGGSDWSTNRNAVTCPRCRERLGHASSARPQEPPASRDARS